MKIDPGQQLHLDSLKKDGQNGIKEKAENIKHSPPAVVNLSSTAKKLHTKADGLESYEEVRPDVVAEAKAELDDWNGLSDDQVDHIMDRMFNDLN